MKTRKAVLSLAAVLVLALVAPVVGQPFADVPTNHWAYDAIAELAAKGLVEGFPDGTFKGNQPLTRYEMAMIVARIIARIEAIPTPPPPEVRRADLNAVRTDLTRATTRIAATERTIATLQRLVNEFRAELQALGVRVTALEEELSALRARLDNTRITGLFDALYIAPVNPPALAGSPLVGALPGYTFGAADLWPRVRLQYTGTVAPGVSVFLRSRYYSTVGGASTIDFDRAFITVDNLFGVERLQLRAGRDAVTLGPIGLLFNEGNGNDRRTGAYLRWTLAPVSLLGFAQWTDAGQADPTTVFGGRLAFTLLPGWTLGVNARADRLNGAAPVPPAGGGGKSDGFGWSADVSGDLLAGLNLALEYANYRNDTTSTTSNYWQARAVLDFATLLGVEAMSPKLTLWYKDYDPLNVPRPRAGLQSPDFYPLFFFTPNLRAFGARLDLQLLENVKVWGLGEWGNFKTALGLPLSGDSWNLWEAGLTWTVAPKLDVSVVYASAAAGGTTVASAVIVYAATSW